MFLKKTHIIDNRTVKSNVLIGDKMLGASKYQTCNNKVIIPVAFSKIAIGLFLLLQLKILKTLYDIVYWLSLHVSIEAIASVSTCC